MRRFAFHLLAGALLLAAAPHAEAQAADDLTAEQRRTIDEGRVVFVTTDVPTSAWPRACVYQRIDATPEEAAAVFTNYERQLTYIPNLKQATISRDSFSASLSALL